MSDDAIGEITVRKMSRMRRVIAERLTQSATTVPHFSVTITIDMTRVLDVRKELRSSGATPSVNDFVLYAVARTLPEFPDVNAYTDGREIFGRTEINLGLAVEVPGGLLVPVIRRANCLSLAQIAHQSKQLARAARDRTLPAKALGGSTFTISSLGMFGVDQFSAIINPGESAILAVASASSAPVWVDNAFIMRQLMKVTLSADHRLVDGALAARFLNSLRNRLGEEKFLQASLAAGHESLRE